MVNKMLNSQQCGPPFWNEGFSRSWLILLAQVSTPSVQYHLDRFVSCHNRADFKWVGGVPGDTQAGG
jgi:hypothetical protein